MAKHPNVDQKLFHQFLNNQCSEAEREIVLRWLSDPENKIPAAQMMETHWAVVNATEGLIDIDVEDLLKETLTRISHDSEPAIRQRPPVYLSPWIKRNVKLLVAASVALLILASALLLSNVIRPTSSGFEKAFAQAKKITTSAAEISEVILPDGTKVKLNAQSSLFYSENFVQHSTREVFLTGEAYFEVTKDAKHPFVVRTKDIDVVVLGTSFNVKSYDGDAKIETTLLEGKVQIAPHDHRAESIQLRPNQKAVFSRRTNAIATHEVDAKNLITWMDQALRFKNEEIGDVLKTMERWYGITIHLEDRVNTSCQLTATFDKNSLPETLEILKSLVGIDYTINGGEVLIKGKLCNP